jgi:hypothetical protein
MLLNYRTGRFFHGRKRSLGFHFQNRDGIRRKLARKIRAQMIRFFRARNNVLGLLQ